MNPQELLSSYTSRVPSFQTALDLFKGHWVSSFPASMGVRAGATPHFDPGGDHRVKFVTDHYDLKGKSILELGPLEGYQTLLLCNAGAYPVLAIEANDIAYLKCLIVKEFMKIDAEFRFGDGAEYLKNEGPIFDVIWGSGVLYHHTDPLLLLKLMCDRARAIFIWTHYWPEGGLNTGPNAPHFESSADIVRTVDDFSAKYHFRTYAGQNFAGFSGGTELSSCWLERDDILNFVKAHGFSINLETHQPDAPPGPVMMFYATRD